MPLQLTPNGVQIETFQEIFDRIANGLRAIYGPDIDLDPESPDGQRVGIQAKAQHDAQSMLLQLYNSFDPDLAVGVRKDSTLKFSGLTRRPAVRSTWDLEVTVNNNGELQDGYTVRDEQDQQWFLDSTVQVFAGANTVTFKAVEFGEIIGLAGQAITQLTFDPNVTTITSPIAATIGRDEETEEELNKRRNVSLQNPAYSVLGALFVKLSQTAGVTDVALKENKSPNYDPVLDLQPNQIWCIVKGGEVDSITETIAKNVTGGTPLKGAEQAIYNETVTRPDGSSFTIQHLINFDRPTQISLYVRADIKQKVTGALLPIDDIKAALSNVDFDIGQSAIATELYATAYSVAGDFILSNLQVSTNGVDYFGELQSGFSGEFFIDVGNIVLTDVTP
jgi:uncharacterized phage protein gp47/JayE